MKHDSIVPLLAEVLEAHGGMDRFWSHRGLSSTIVTGGALWGIKGIEMPPTPRRVMTEFQRQWTAITPFGEEGWTMIWTPQRLMIQQATDLIADRSDPRQSFAGHGYDTPWDPLHLAYFNGYAMWTYHAFPFVIASPGYEVREIESIVDEGRLLRGLSVRLPSDVESHTREQRLYFGSDGLLRRHDYEVDVMAGTAASHYPSDYVEVEGLRFPTRRIVHPREADGNIRRDVTTVSIALSDYALR